MISLKDYAAQSGVTYEAVRQQVRRYENELEGHIEKDGRIRYLDDYAVDYLGSKKSKSPVVIIEQAKDERIEELEMEVNNLRIQLFSAQDKIATLQEEKFQLVDAGAKYQLLEQTYQQTENTLKAVQEEAKETESKLRESLLDAEKTAAALKKEVEIQVTRLVEKQEELDERKSEFDSKIEAKNVEISRERQHNQRLVKGLVFALVGLAFVSVAAVIGISIVN